MARRWKSPALAVEGVITGDGREIAPGALTWSAFPLPLAWLQAQQHGMGMEGAVDLGNIAEMSRVDGGKIPGSGTIDDASEAGAEFCRKLDDGTAPMGSRWGLSIDTDDCVLEIIDLAPEEVDPNAADEAMVASARPAFTLTGSAARKAWTSGARPVEVWKALTAAAGDTIPDDAVVVDSWDPGRFVMRMTAARVRGVTACQIAAFDETYLELEAADAEDAGSTTDDATDDAVTASGRPYPVKPPSRFFHHPEPASDDDPELVPQYDARTGAYLGLAVPLTIITDGPNRGLAYGHLAPAERCHIAIDGMCQTAPDSRTAYAHFHLGEVHTSDGKIEHTGAFVIGCDHAPHHMTMGQARDHYANTGLAWADMKVRPGKYGPWFSGALRPDVSDELVRTLRGGGVSGDWRGADGALELMAVQAVNTPGFTVQRVALAAGGAVEIRPWVPRIEIADGIVSVTTAPVQRAVDPVTAAATCGCQHGETVTLASLDAKIDALTKETRTGFGVLKARTAQFRTTAFEQLRETFTRR